MPPEPLHSKITLIKKDFKWEYSSSAALRSPPHITLHMPFKTDGGKLSFVRENFIQRLKTESPFLINLVNFGAFPPRVIFINVMENESLLRLYEIISEVMKNSNFTNQDYRGLGFHPHITVAFRDLKKREFVRAWEIYKGEQIKGEFECNSICIFKHNGKFWEVDSEIKLINDQ